MEEKIEFILDLSNIVHENYSHEVCTLKNYEKVKSELKSINSDAKIIPIADARTRHIIDKKHKFESLIIEDQIIQAPPGEKADYYILEYAKKHPRSLIISNDRFKEYPNENGLKKRVIPYKIINGDVIFSPKLEKKKSCPGYMNLTSTNEN